MTRPGARIGIRAAAWVAAVLALILFVDPPSRAAQSELTRLEKELAQLVTPDEAAFLLREISSISPPERIAELADYPEQQEGAANRARGDDVSAADERIAAGLRSNGPLYSLGWFWAGLIADVDGTHAVGECISSKGPSDSLSVPVSSLL
jgi:hypothetical protein